MPGHRLRRIGVALLFLVVGCVGLWVPLYNRTEPTLAGLPFFYWFQIVWIVVGAVVVGLGYALRAKS
jgi:hypothetical protein